MPLISTVVAVTLCTVVPGGMFVPETAIPALIPAVPPAPPKVSVLPDWQSLVVVAVTGAAGGLGISANAMGEPPETAGGPPGTSPKRRC